MAENSHYTVNDLMQTDFETLLNVLKSQDNGVDTKKGEEIVGLSDFIKTIKK